MISRDLLRYSRATRIRVFKFMSLNINNKTVFITGASSGIGKACAYQFAALGCRLILTARREERLTEIADDLKQKYQVDVLMIQLNVQDKKQVQAVFVGLPKEWVNIDILINNAGLALGTDKYQDSQVDNWDVMIDTNVKGLLYVTHEALKTMVPRNSGHIINIGSVAGQEYYPAGNIYCATKHAVRAISKTLRLDLLGKAIRVSEVAPGAVHTEFSEVRWKDKERADNFYKGISPLMADDIADAAVYCATRPLHVDVAEITIYPTMQASTNHIYRES